MGVTHARDRRAPARRPRRRSRRICCGPAGGVRTGALLTMLDNVGGLNGGLAALPDGWVVSTNLAARVVALAHAGPLRIDSGVLRRGRNNVVTERADPRRRRARRARRRAACSPRRSSSPRTVRRSGAGRSRSTAPGAAPTICRRSPSGSACARSATDAVEIDLADELRNPWGILHGGVVATLVDLAAEHATGGGYTTDVVLHFLAPNRVGPVRATARVLGRRSDGTVLRVEVRDEGADRTTAVAIVDLRAASS